MDDNKIIELYFNRNEKAIEETNKKYGKYCTAIAYNILQNNEDVDECINDTYLNVWNSIPPEKPNFFKLYIAKITRNIALHIYQKNNAKKRYKGVNLIVEELEECLPSDEKIEEGIEYAELVEYLNQFLYTLSDEKRRIFLDRYWYMKNIKDISINVGITEANIKVILHRLRCKLKEFLEERGASL